MADTLQTMKSRSHERFLLLVAVASILFHVMAGATETYVPFEGEKSAWHDGFDRFDFVMDEATLAIKPFRAPADEKFGIKDPQKGQRRCVVVVPKRRRAATRGRGRVATGITNLKPKSSFSTVAFTSPILQPTPRWGRARNGMPGMLFLPRNMVFPGSLPLSA